MTVVDALNSVEFVTDREGKRTAVVLRMQAWERLLEWLEDAADAKLAGKALSELQKMGGRPSQAGFLAWDDVSEDWDAEESTEPTTPSI